jgi:hypothetical protein
MGDETRVYGTPMGTEPPGTVKRERPKAGPADEKTLRAKLKEYEARAQGEARRETTAPKGGRRLKYTPEPGGIPRVDAAVQKAESGE